MLDPVRPAPEPSAWVLDRQPLEGASPEGKGARRCIVTRVATNGFLGKSPGANDGGFTLTASHPPVAGSMSFCYGQKSEGGLWSQVEKKVCIVLGFIFSVDYPDMCRTCYLAL